MTPLEITAGVISIANGVFTLSTNFWKLKNVDDDLKTCVHLILMVTRDANTARRLRNRKYPHHRTEPVVQDSLIDRTNSAIADLEKATKEISKSIEAVRVEKSVDGCISVVNRVRWAFQKKDCFIAQQFVVNAAHNRVLAVIANLEGLPDAQKPVTMMEPPPPYEDVILRSPSQARALEGKSSAVLVTAKECALDPRLGGGNCLQAQAQAQPATSMATKSLPLFDDEDFTDQDMVNEMILARWKNSG